MKLDVTALRYIEKHEWRVLTSLEQLSKNHDWSPTPLISRVANVPPSLVEKGLKVLRGHNLISHSKQKYDGYRLTPLGYDYLALRAFCLCGIVQGLGNQIGVGKEADVHVVVTTSKILEREKKKERKRDEQRKKQRLKRLKEMKEKEKKKLERQENLRQLKAKTRAASNDGKKKQGSDDDDDNDTDDVSSDDNVEENRLVKKFDLVDLSDYEDEESEEESDEEDDDDDDEEESEPVTVALKIHRLGRTSFRNVKQKRDYLKKRKTSSWLYLSRLSALKEYAFLSALYQRGYPVPRPIRVNRHMVVMELVDGYPLTQVNELANPRAVYESAIELLLELASFGIIHCDFNEFNLMINDDEVLTVIDFPQAVSIDHMNAEMYFDRDVKALSDFFIRKHKLVIDTLPSFSLIKRKDQLDESTDASGNKHRK